MLLFRLKHLVVLNLLFVVAKADYVSFKVSCRDLIPRENDKDVSGKIALFSANSEHCIKTPLTDLPDVFVKTWYNGEEVEHNKHTKDNQYPRFSDTFTVYYNPANYTPIVIELRENDELRIGDDEMGKIYVYPRTLAKGVERIVWKDGNYVGKIRFRDVSIRKDLT